MLDARPTTTMPRPSPPVFEVAFVAPEAADAPPPSAAPSLPPPPSTPPPPRTPPSPSPGLPAPPNDAPPTDAPEAIPEADPIDADKAMPLAPEDVSVPAAPAENVPPATAPSPPSSRTPLTRQERNYFAVISAHLNRRKTYPAEAKQARQQGVVVVRFRIDRDGRVLSADIKRGSGHALLDDATLELLRRVSPLPRIPRSIDRDELTLSLPIDYALTTD